MAYVIELLNSSKVYSYEGGLKLEGNTSAKCSNPRMRRKGFRHFLKSGSRILKGNNKRENKGDEQNMNIYVLMKRTFDTEEKIQIEQGKSTRTERNSSSIRTMSTPLKKRSS